VFVRTDVLSETSVAAALARAEEHGPVRIAVVAHGGTGSQRTLDRENKPAGQELFMKVLTVFLGGTYNVVRLAAASVAKSQPLAEGERGVIITTASMSGHIINTPQQVGHYCASKAAVIQLTKAMAVEFAPYNIRVNSVSPGYILTELVEPYAEYHPLWEPKIPLGRLGRPEELVGIYVYLASDASSYMTGSDIVIDGGYTCW